MSVSLYQGNCLDYMSTMQSVDIIIADPPYSEHVHAKHVVGSKKKYGESKEINFSSLSDADRKRYAKAMGRIVSRWCLVFSDIETSHLWRQELEVSGLEYIRTGIWVKENSAPQFTGDRPASGAEAVTICHPKGKKSWNGGGKSAVWQYKVSTTHNNEKIDMVRFHVTQKPLPLLERIISDFTNPGDTILDPFMGSGTTGVACVKLGRNFIGCEIVPEYFEQAKERIQQVSQQLSLLSHFNIDQFHNNE